MSKTSTDWRAAGIKADAHRVRNAMRRGYSGSGKRLARKRIIEALRASGVTTVLDFWGGGLSAVELVAAGFTVICVENGSQIVEIDGRRVSMARKKRAFLLDAEEAGFTPFWGNAAAAIAAHPEIDGAFLDFCGPWTSAARATVHATRDLVAVAVTLMPDHDMSTGAANVQERQLAYQLFLKMARAESPRWGYMNASGCRILTDYDGGHGQRVTVYWMSDKPVRLRVVPVNERAKMRGDVAARVRTIHRERYRRMDTEEKVNWQARSRHNDHLRTGRLPVKPCPVCDLQREPMLCCVCGDVVPIDRALKAAKYCSTGCMNQAKTDKQRHRRGVTARLPRRAPCARCGTVFQPERGNNLRKPLCGRACKEANYREYKAEWYQLRKLAAVSGTAAEAVKG